MWSCFNYIYGKVETRHCAHVLMELWWVWELQVRSYPVAFRTTFQISIALDSSTRQDITASDRDPLPKVHPYNRTQEPTELLSGQLANTDMDEFSLAERIIDRLNVVDIRSAGWAASTSAEQAKHDALPSAIGWEACRGLIPKWTRSKNHLRILTAPGWKSKILPPTRCLVSKFGRTPSLALQTRLMQREFPSMVLFKQHRMNPEIASLVDTLLCEDRLRDHASVFDRENARLFERWVLSKRLPPRQTLFIDVTSQSNSIYREERAVYL